RVLGFNKNGRKYLSTLKKDIDIYTSIKNGINKEFDLEIHTDKILDIVYKENLLSKEIKGPIIK
nr:nucleotidyltransferase family protein [Acholeplasmatales bacterium]